MHTWTGFPHRHDPRLAVAALLLLYVGLGITVLGFNRHPLQIALAVGAAMLLDMGLHWLLHGGPPLFPLSAAITGLGLSILVNFAHSPWYALVPVGLAIASKYVFTLHGRHVYNPGLFGVVASLYVGDGMISDAPAYQWGGSYAVLAFVITLALVLFVWRIRRVPLMLTFLLAYSVALAGRAWMTRWHVPVETWFMGALTAPAFFVFTFFMITDPQTSPASPRGQVVLAIGLVAVDFLLHLHATLSTLFYAAFFCATLRLFWGHLGGLCEGWEATCTRLRYALPRWGVVAALGAGGWWVASQPGVRDGSLAVDFRLVAIPTQEAGISGRPSDILERVDPRLTHIAKWLLSVGDAVAVADVDHDGLQDVFLTHALKDPQDRVALYRNLGGWRFARIPIPALTALAHAPEQHGLASGALFLDYDNDGDQDLLVVVGWGHAVFLQNRLCEDGRLAFVDITQDVGLEDYLVGVAANALDVDRDGQLDLILGNAMRPTLPGYTPPQRFNVFRLPLPQDAHDRRMFNFMHRTWHNAANGGGTLLYLRRGTGFQRVDGAAFGLTETRWTLAIGAGDVNNDGWPDLYLANDFGPDQLLLNRHGQRFDTVQGRLVGAIGRDTYKGMNASLGDLDGNGYLDIYVSNVHERLQAEGSLLWMNRGGDSPQAWSDEAVRRNALNEKRFGWGAAFGDVDRDGRLDIVQANGMVDNRYDPLYPDCPDYWYWNDKIALTPPDVHGYADRWADLRGRCIFPFERNRVYLNRGTHFVDVATRAGWSQPGNSRGIAVVDLDNDGDLDVLVTHQFEPVSLFRNDSTPKSWLGLELLGNGITCNRDAVGTRVTVSIADGALQQMREVHAANGFAAQSERRLLFGFGEASGPITVVLHWCGEMAIQRLTLAAGQYYQIQQPLQHAK